MKVGVVNSVKKRNDKTWNGVEQILLGRRMSGCKFACQENTDFFFSDAGGVIQRDSVP
jgi:hypothetical protein